jgi:hypothetical protein
MTMFKHSPILNRSFGLLFASVFGLLSVYSANQNAELLTVYSLLSIGAGFGFVAFAAPKLLSPFSKAWMRLGDLMGKLISPLVLGAIFYMLITPVALVTRLFGRDEMRLKRTKINTYWIDRDPPGPAGVTFKNQF